MLVTKVISGGQTGVDQAALAVAIQCGIEHGGWCPLGRLCETGTIPEEYRLSETESSHYAVRTEQNVLDSDGTLVLYQGELTRGTALTVKLLERHGQPHFLLNFDAPVGGNELLDIQAWLLEYRVGVLNVAGPRASTNPEVGQLTFDFLLKLFDLLRSDQDRSGE
ncbi:MAG: putative molybdenum carrier protein [Mariniblastus sp.]|nr:putative molybdenum carrier protein [Mariniblastus sp.]